MAEYRTLRRISKRMGWRSPNTPLRRNKFDDFPMYPVPTSTGLIWCTSDFLIGMWEQRKAEMSRGIRLRVPYKHKKPRHPYFYKINGTSTGTENTALSEERKRSYTRNRSDY